MPSYISGCYYSTPHVMSTCNVYFYDAWCGSSVNIDVVASRSPSQVWRPLFPVWREASSSSSRPRAPNASDRRRPFSLPRLQCSAAGNRERRVPTDFQCSNLPPIVVYPHIQASLRFWIFIGNRRSNQRPHIGRVGRPRVCSSSDPPSQPFFASVSCQYRRWG